MIPTGRGQRVPIRRKRDTSNRSLMASENIRVLLASYMPYSDETIIVTSHYLFAVCREGYRVENILVRADDNPGQLCWCLRSRPRHRSRNDWSRCADGGRLSGVHRRRNPCPDTSSDCTSGKDTNSGVNE